MGERFTDSNHRLTQPPKGSTVTGTLPGKPHAGPAPAEPARGNRPAPATGTGTPARTGTGDGTRAGTQEEKKLPGLAPVTPPGVDVPPLPESPKKKARKPRQTKKKDEPQTFTAQQLTALLVSISTIVASRPGCEMFALSEMEAEQIAKPLASMAAKSEKFAGMAEHSDAIALVTACVVIMAPRLMLFFDGQKQRKLKAAGGVKIVRTDEGKDKDRPGAGDNRKTAGPGPKRTEDAFNGLFAAIPPVL